MAVFRVERNSNYTTMSNYHLRDNNLSLKAKGLLSVFLSLPDSWHYSVRGLVAICKEGRDCIVATLQELAKLKTEFPSDWQERLERLSEYIASSGKHYKNHLATLRSWARRDKPKTAAYSHSN